MLFNNKIDVIIPAYNVPDKTLFECLSSIAVQNIATDLKITIVDDASTDENYAEIIKLFEKFLDIQLLKLDINGGPGVARQYGLDHTENEFVTFIDADDIFSNGFALQLLREPFNNSPLCQQTTGDFEELVNLSDDPNDIMFYPHEQDGTWMFGKMYRRLFLEKYNIRFHPTSRANEDAGFNALCKLYCMASPETEKIEFIPTTVYFWKNTDNSITRKNNCLYAISGEEGQGFHGYVENLTRSIKEVLENKKVKNLLPIKEYGISTMIGIYVLYVENLQRASEKDSKLNFKWCREYFKTIYEPIEKELKEIDEKEFEQKLRIIYYDNIVNGYKNNSLVEVIPTITFFDFLNQLKNEEN